MIPESVIIVLPLPVKVLLPNYTIGSIGGRFMKARATKKYRRLAKEAVEAEHIKTAPWKEIGISAQFYYATKRRRDIDNAISSLKAAYDGITDAGLITDDDSKHVGHRTIEFLSGGCPRVELTITRLR